LKFNITGLDSLEKQLKAVVEEAKKTIGKKATLEKLFPPEFMKKHTKYDSIVNFMNDFSPGIKTREDFNKINLEEFDEFIKNNTDFDDWDSFKTAAGTIFAKEKLEKRGFNLK